ncbi:MAG: BlaI/MecI/CopY family transcriptional regulator [Planctomycetaceae bacterium]
MDAVWRLGRVTVQDVCDALDRPLAYTTVMTTLRILHTKRKVVTREKEGRAYVYQASVSRQDVYRSVSEELKRHLIRGSLKSFVLNLIQDESPSDVAALRKAIETLEETR